MAYVAFLTNLIGLDGSVESGGLINSYVRNTTTRSPLFSDVSGTPYTTNPVVAESLGQVSFYYRDDVQYSWRATTADGATVLWQADVVGGVIYPTWINPGLLSEFEASATGTGASQIVTIEDVVLTSPYQVLVSVDALIQSVTGYSVSSDGTDSFVTLTAPIGAAIYVRSNAVQGVSITGDNLIVTPTGGTVGRTLAAWTGDVFNVKAGWGGAAAVGDGTTDDAAAINRAITACNAAGGGIVFFPAGTYMVGNTSVGVTPLSNTFLVGVSRDVVTLRLKNSIAGTAVVHFNGVSHTGLRGITVDGNRDNNPSGSHGIRIASCDDITIEDFKVKEAAAYGIGHQAGTLTRCFIRHGILSRIGGDGFDFKNREFATTPNDILTLDDIVVEEWALATSVDQQAAVDIRGPFNVSNIILRDPGSDNCAGIRFRQDDLGGGGNGPGGRYSNLVNFQINMGTATAGQGLYIAGQYVKATNGYVEGGQDGVICAEAAHFVGTGIVAKDCADDGFVFDATSHDFVLTGCKALDAGDTGFNVTSDRGKLIGCSADGCDEAFVAAATVANLEIDNMTMTNSVTRAGQIVAGATDVKIRGGVVADNVNILDAGTNTTIRDLSGYTTQARGTASGTTDGSGDLTVTHGLITTPARVRVTTGGTTFMQAQVHTKGSTTFKIRFLDAAGAALTATSAAADWEAETALFG